MGIDEFPQASSPVGKGKYETHRQPVVPMHVDKEGRLAYARVTTDTLSVKINPDLAQHDDGPMYCNLTTKTQPGWGKEGCKQ